MKRFLGMVLLGYLPRASEPGFFLVGIGLAGWQWLLPLAVPLAAAAVAWAAAGAATRRGLRRWRGGEARRCFWSGRWSSMPSSTR